MLSKIALLVLSCIAEQPLNPYQIKKIFAELKMETWFPMATSSIYATIKALVKHGYITGAKARSGNMPEKTIYTITPEGQTVLQQSLVTALQEREPIVSEFDLAILFLFHVPQTQALEALRAHHAHLEREIARRTQASIALEGSIPFSGLIQMQHGIYKREAELKTVTELIQQIEAATEWNHSLVLDMMAKN